MEGYLKNLLNDFGERDSSMIHIVDDNFNSSISSLNDYGRNKYRRRPSIRRAQSMDAAIVASDVYSYCPGESHSRGVRHHLSPKTRNSNYNKNRKQLSARMERHRLSRWDASPSSKPSVTSAARRSPLRSSSGFNTTELLESLASTTIGTPGKGKIASGADEDNKKPLREFDDNKMKTTSATATTSKDDNVFMKNAIRDRERTCSYKDFLTGSMDLSNQFIINKALAISDGKMESEEMQYMTNDMKTNKDKTKSTYCRLKGGRRSKVDSMLAPPHVPIRRKSIEEIDVESSSLLLKERSHSAKVGIPSSLLELPYYSSYSGSHSI